MSNRITLTALIVLLAMIALAVANEAAAFHDGGVAECDGCHTMHNASEGRSVTVNPLPTMAANPFLLQASDASGTCLNCHQKSGDTGPTSYHVSTPAAEMPAGLPPKQLAPGGDFGWLRKNYSWIPAFGQSPASSYGERHGHSIVSIDYGYLPDSGKQTAPGGSYPVLSLGCTSCHDPHGSYRRNLDGTITAAGKPIKGSGSYDTSAPPDSAAAVGAYRLLGGVGYAARAVGSGLAFVYGPPAAVAPETYNRSEALSVTRVAYGTGMSDWCRNCHTNMHNDVYPTPLKHLSGSALGSTLISNYNRYVRTGNLSGVEAAAYESLVPFEIGSDNYTLLKGIVTSTPTKGPNSADGNAAVMCLTCHRAHASGWDSATRWNTKTEFIVYNGMYSQATEMYQPYGQGRSEIEAVRAYYDTPASKFALQQKSLCNKCHIGDSN